MSSCWFFVFFACPQETPNLKPKNDADTFFNTPILEGGAMALKPLAAARVAVALSRTVRAAELTVDDVARDAERIAFLGARARDALGRQRPCEAVLSEAARLLEKYGAELVAQQDLEGCVMGARFRGPVQSSGFRNIFYIS